MNSLTDRTVIFPGQRIKFQLHVFKNQIATSTDNKFYNKKSAFNFHLFFFFISAWIV